LQALCQIDYAQIAVKSNENTFNYAINNENENFRANFLSDGVQKSNAQKLKSGAFNWSSIMAGSIDTCAGRARIEAVVRVEAAFPPASQCHGCVSVRNRLRVNMHYRINRKNLAILNAINLSGWMCA
jgi:hypothetical protein